MDPSYSSIINPIGLSDKFWYLEIIIGLVFLIGVNFIFKRVVKQIRLRSISKSSSWKEKLDYILYMPFEVLIWVLGLTLVIQVLEKRFEFSIFGTYINAARITGLVLCIGWVLLRWKNVLQRELVGNEIYSKKLDRGFVQVLGKVAAIVIFILSAMIIMQVWGVNVGPLMAFSGIGAAAVGFSAKDVLSNFFGGLMLHINRPFIVGDYINLRSPEVEGSVEEIGWNLTTIRDKDKRPVYLPNSTFSNTLVVNSTRMTHRRIFEKVGIRYEDFDKIPQIVKNVKQALSEEVDVDTHLPVLIVFNGFGSSTLDLLIDIYVLKTRYEQFLICKQQILSVIYKEIIKTGAEMPYPLLSISGKLAVNDRHSEK